MKYTFIFVLLFIVSTNCYSQLSIGGSIKSRYIWRGIDLGNSPSLQPYLSYTYKQFNFTVVGAYGFPDSGKGYAENDFILSYNIPLSFGTFSVICVDLYFPSMGAKFFNTKGDGTGGHTLETGLQFMGTESFPLITRAFICVHNDPDNSTYFEFEYPFVLDSLSLSVFTGIAGNKSNIYSTEKVSMINIGFTALKNIVINSSTSIMISTSFIINPHIEQSYFVLGIGF